MLSQEFDNKTSTVDPALFIYFCPFLKSGEVIQNASGFSTLMENLSGIKTKTWTLLD